MYVAIIYHFIIPFIAFELIDCFIYSISPLDIILLTWSIVAIYLPYFDFRFVKIYIG